MNKVIEIEKEVKVPKVKPRVQEFNYGIEDGRNAATMDYVNERVDLSLFDGARNFKDHYGMGFELGYLTKLAEIAVG